jgi:leucyl-tRNA synthetase
MESFSLNTAVAAFMEYNNRLIAIAKKEGGVDLETVETSSRSCSLRSRRTSAEEIWQRLGHTDSVFHSEWPTYSEEAMKEDTIKLPVQINGKTRTVIEVPADISRMRRSQRRRRQSRTGSPEPL